MPKRVNVSHKIDFSTLTAILEPSESRDGCRTLAELTGTTWIDDRWLPAVEPFLKRQGVHLVKNEQGVWT